MDEMVAKERSGHTAVVEGSLLYVWGGYVVNALLLLPLTHKHLYTNKVSAVTLSCRWTVNC